MKDVNRKLGSMILSVLLLCIVAGGFQVVTAQQPPQQRDVLLPLQRALSEAGAPALTAQQEEQLKSLVEAFRASRRPQGPSTALQAARRAYDEAIVAGDNAAAQSQAAIIANQIAATTRANLAAEANFKIQVVGVLKTNDDQVDFLLKLFGTGGLSQLLSVLAGREGPFPGREGER